MISLSEELNKTIKTLMDEIPFLRSHVPNENREEIAVIELLQHAGRKKPTIFQQKGKGDFCIKLVHAVLQTNQTNGPEIALLPLFKSTTTPSVTPSASRVSPGISSQDSASSFRNISSFSCPANLDNANVYFDSKYATTIDWLVTNNRMFQGLVITFLQRHTEWGILKSTGSALNVRTLCADLTDSITKFMDSVDSFRVTPSINNPPIGIKQISAINEGLKTELKHLKHRVNSQRCKFNKKESTGLCQHKNMDVCGGLGMGWMVDPLPLQGNSLAQLAMVTSISPDTMKTVLEIIQERGFIDVDEVMELHQRVSQVSAGNGICARQKVIKSILETFPIVSVHVEKSCKTFLVDGLQPPEGVFAALSNDETPSECRASQETKFREEWLHSLKIEDDMWNELMDTELTAEFATEIYNEGRKGQDDQECALLKKYPDLLAHISAILGKHGTAHAHARRRDDKVYHTGVSARSISRYLFGEFKEDVSPVTIWRLFTHRKNDTRSIRSGGSYGFIHTELLAKKNSQFCQENLRGHFAASKMRHMKEWVTWLFVEKGVKGAIFHVDEMSKVPLIHDATSYLMLNGWRGSVLAGDGPNFFDHTFLPQYTCKGNLRDSH